MMPQIVSFPNKIISYVGVPIAIIGVVCIIGMCVLDFIWWSYPTQQMRNQFASHISKVPSIWKPFITTGTNFLNIGLLLLSLNYFRKNKLGTITVVIASLMIFIGMPIPFRLVFGYLLTAIGFAIIFYKKTTYE
mgnify:CR=1 FL=1